MALATPEWAEVLHCLVNRLPLPVKYQDHPLKDSPQNYRDCHIKPDLVLIYKLDDDCLYLVNLGTHADIF